MRMTRSFVLPCAALACGLACGEAAMEPARNAHGPATVVSVPEPSPEGAETGQDASEDGVLAANSSAPRLASFAGEYHGKLMSTGEMVPAMTHLRWREGALTGYYTFGHQLDERGTLRRCSELEPNIVRCEWRDTYGTGVLELSFSSDASEFEGKWSSDAEPEVFHPWAGARLGEAE